MKISETDGYRYSLFLYLSHSHLYLTSLSYLFYHHKTSYLCRFIVVDNRSLCHIHKNFRLLTTSLTLTLHSIINKWSIHTIRTLIPLFLFFQVLLHPVETSSLSFYFLSFLFSIWHNGSLYQILFCRSLRSFEIFLITLFLKKSVDFFSTFDK